MSHIPVLKEEVLALFECCDLQLFIDATVGAGGHAAAIMSAHKELERFIGIDQDPTALNLAEISLRPWQNLVTLLRGNFSSTLKNLLEQGVGNVDGILMDLGVSSMQLDTPEKGFSFRKEGPLDMRMDPTLPLTAEEIVNSWPVKELSYLFYKYGEEKRARKAAEAIAKAREKKAIKTTTELAEILREALPKRQKKEIDPATLVFQALRLKVNRELEVLEEALPTAISLLKPGGRLAVITFHSLEDRIVKNYFRYAASDKEDTRGLGGLFIDKKPTVNLITRKPEVAKEKELEENPRSRSAKLRVIEKR